MYVEKKQEAIDKSTELGLTLEQFATIAICRDLANSGTLVFASPDEDDGRLEFYIENVIDLMYIKDAEKYRAIAAEKKEAFEITVARALARVLTKWVEDRRRG
jgi:hypothetical protein